MTDITNCIFWGDTSGFNLEIGGWFTNVTYSDVSGGFGGTGNIDADPLFVGNPLSTGAWTSDPLYEPVLSQSTLTDDSQSWAPSSLAGLYLQPDSSGYLQFPILRNTATTVTVWGDMRALTGTGSSYNIYDYHIGANSPAKDTGTATGAPKTDLEGNPRPSCPGYDMGAYEYQCP